MVDAQPAHKKPANPDSFDWPLANDAEGLLRQILAEFLQKNTFAKCLSERMRQETATDFFEWIDHFRVGKPWEERLTAAGFVPDTRGEAPPGELLLAHPQATLPPVRLASKLPADQFEIALRPEFVADFAAGHDLGNDIEGDPFSRYRLLRISQERGTSLDAVERHAYRGFTQAEI